MEWLRVLTLWAKNHGCDRYVRKLIRGWALYDMAMYCATQRDHRYMSCPRCVWVWSVHKVELRDENANDWWRTHQTKRGTYNKSFAWNRKMHKLYKWLHNH
jgi:CRISPR/Cas system-associated exonuclease Cas4 (RecB family)